MAVFTIHLRGDADDPAALERAVFVREGFAWGAFVFGPFWLIRHRAWRGLLVWFAVQAVLIALVAFAPLPRAAAYGLQALIALFMGFEGGQIRRGALTREGYRAAGVAAAEARADAERRFFAAHAAEIPAATAANAREAPRGATPAMVGMFPWSGGRAQ